MSVKSRWAQVSTNPLKAVFYLLFLTALLSVPVYLFSSHTRAQFNVLYMLIPSVVPFGLFWLERLRKPSHQFSLRFLLDLIVIGISVGRIFSSWPYISGHSLFFSYATFTTFHPLTRIVTGSAVIYTAFWKITHSDNLLELWTGALYGLGFAILYRLLSLKRAEQGAAANP